VVEKGGNKTTNVGIPHKYSTIGDSLKHTLRRKTVVARGHRGKTWIPVRWRWMDLPFSAKLS
jgi:hypothetical protein